MLIADAKLSQGSPAEIASEGIGKMRLRFRWTCIFLAALVSSCAHHTEIPFDHTAQLGIKRVGVVEPAVNNDVHVVLAASIGRSLGLIGALVDAGMESNRDGTMKKLLVSQAFDTRSEFKSALDQALRTQGYQPVPILVPVERSNAEFLKSYPVSTSEPVDAYLDVTVVNYGFLAAGISDSAPYRPSVLLKVRLVSASDQKVILMNDTVIVNPLGTPEDAVAVSPPAEYFFDDFDKLTADPVRTRDALKLAVDQSATTVAQLLK